MATRAPALATTNEHEVLSLVPVDQDARLIEVRRLGAEAGAHCTETEARYRGLLAVLTDPNADALARLEAETEITEAELAWKRAVLARQRLGNTERATRAPVKTELHAALDPGIRVAVAAEQEALERLQAEEHRALLDRLEEYLRLMGDAHPQAADLVIPMLSAPAGNEDFVRFHHRALRERGWL